MSICDSCQSGEGDAPQVILESSPWVSELEHNFIAESIKKHSRDTKQAKPLFSDTSVEIFIEPDTLVFYWAAETSAEREFQRDFPTAQCAYANMRNIGIAKSDSKGRARLRMRLPAIYCTLQKDGRWRPWGRHVHFVKQKNGRFSTFPPFHTARVLPELGLPSFKRFLRSSRCLSVCAITTDLQIPGSVTIPYFESLRNIERTLQSAAARKTTPIVVFCANASCNASELLAKKLQELDFVNVFVYPGGLAEYFQAGLSFI